MKITKHANVIEADIHFMTVSDAKKELEKLLSSVSPKITEIIVIHGYHDGTRLLEMVRFKLKHRKIKRKILSLNMGETILVLK